MIDTKLFLTIFSATLPIFGAILWNLIEVRSIRAELLEIRTEIAKIRESLQSLAERVATLEERDRLPRSIVRG